MNLNVIENNFISYGLPQLKLSLTKTCNTKIKKIVRPKDVLNNLTPLKLACEEYFLSIHLNPKLEIIGIHEVSHGTLTASLIHPREVFKAACLANSHALILCHNHPSGALEPSSEDLNVTSQLINAGSLMGIVILDHIIVGGGKRRQHYSLRENYGYLWES